MNRKEKKSRKRKKPQNSDPNQGGGSEINLDAIEQFLKNGIEAIPVENDSLKSLDAEIIKPLQLSPDEDEKPEPESEEDEKSQKQPEESDPGLATLVLREGFGDLEVRISPDRMSASISVFEPRRQDISVKEVVRVLNENKIVFGIKERAIQTVLRASAKRGRINPNITIAQGIPVIEGEDARFLLECLDDKPEEVGFPPELTENILEEMDKVRQAFQNRIEYLKEEPLKGILVDSGQCAIRKLPNQEGKSGISIFNVEHFPKAGKEASLKVGSSISLSEDGLKYHAKTFGYLIVYDDVVSIISPFIISKDKMTAYFVNLPPLKRSKPFRFDRIREATVNLGITHGLEEEEVSSLISGQAKDQVLEIARGTQPENGKDGTTKLKVDVTEQPGTFLEDGTIDFRERSVVTNVSADALIAVYTIATKGIPGRTVTGNTVKAANGKNSRPRVGVNVSFEEEGNTVLFTADKKGNVRFENNKLSVQDRYSVPGDVNYKSGNINFDGDVEVLGSILPGFSVRATGSITVNGSVEMGAKLEAGEDIVVSRGIVGPTTKVKAEGDLLARFISSSTIESRGNITVGSYVHNATISAGGYIRVYGRGRLKRQTSAAVGGTLVATKKVWVASAGSGFGSQTRLIAGVDPRRLEQMQKIRSGIMFCDTNIVKILRALHISKITLKNIHKAVQRAPAEKQSIFILLIAKIQELVKVRQKCIDEEKEIKEQQEQILGQAVVQVDGIVYPGVKAQVGTVATPVLTALEGVDFRLDMKENKIVLGVVMDNLV